MTPVRISSAALAALFAGCASAPPDAAFDRDPPKVSATTPADGSSDADPAAELSIQFARSSCVDCTPCDIDPASLDEKVSFMPQPTRTLRVRLDVEACALRIHVSGGLDEKTSYGLTLKAGVRDVFGNTLATDTKVVFKTGARTSTDKTPPRLVGTWPPEGDTRLGRHMPVVLFFDEEVVGTPSSFAGGDSVQPTLRPDSYSLILAPVTAWTAGPLTLTLTKVADRAGNEQVEPLTLRFTVPPGTDEKAPDFGGISKLEASPAGLVASWAAATDDVSAASAIRYLVYVGPADTPLDLLLLPTFVVAPGSTSLTIAPGAKPLQVLVRAQDEAGNIDTNLQTAKGEP